ncbi:uncharacterized protein LOC107483171 [Arachis duranensis]|uniref:Uncharacterized protein LOC107483171 n=1 Tax=Arachis duranensis TaxID=130453 RepID=A0A6P5NKA7_ARADU|nr:uncharacterized protein LOC107483171 [Arachis duranensis]
MSDYRYFQSKAILAPTLKSVEKVNDFVLTIFPGMEKEYLSSYTTCQANENKDVQQEWFISEFQNKIKSLGLPNHKLTLKPGAAIMLLQNIDQTSGLYNGTRLIVNELDNNVIGVTSQGQSLCHVGFCLPKSVFTHGQLYVALSRVKSCSGFKVLILDEDSNPKSSTTNVIYN